MAKIGSHIREATAKITNASSSINAKGFAFAEIIDTKESIYIPKSVADCYGINVTYIGRVAKIRYSVEKDGGLVAQAIDFIVANFPERAGGDLVKELAKINQELALVQHRIDELLKKYGKKDKKIKRAA